MKKNKIFESARFSADVWRQAIELFREKFPEKGVTSHLTCSVTHDDGATWHYDNVDEFISELRRTANFATFYLTSGKANIIIFRHRYRTEVTVQALSRQDIEQIFDIFERNLSISIISEDDGLTSGGPTVFIGHGMNSAWRDLKDHLQDKHDITVEAYESGARAGHVIRDILDDMIERSSFAILVLTGEDQQADGNIRARQNVIHEAGLFQGRLGFSRAIVLIENGVERFSNLDGIQYIEFSKGNIKETFGDVVATIKREFP
jgi:hypothetical protein